MEKSFLGNVAHHLYEQYGDMLSDVTIVMPNMRSRLFFLDELGKLIDRPVWHPHYESIDGLMQNLSGYKPLEHIRAIVELYKVYSRHHNENFDSFYFWGEVLLNDFDQIDKYMVDADMLFANLADLKAIGGDLTYMDENQRSVIRRFWGTLADFEQSDTKQAFLKIWNSLAPIYHEFRERLSSMKMAYAGMIHRLAAERLCNNEISVTTTGPIAVVGFNALTSCEKILFDHLHKVHGAQFFWDYDDYYLLDDKQEAGLFIRENKARYGQAEGFINDTDNFSRHKDISAISVPSGAMQCKYAASFLNNIPQAGKETAIVLTDESLLVPLLHSIPDNIDSINITMGYPLRQTLIYSFTERLLKLQSRAKTKQGEPAFYHADITGILTHPFISETDGDNAARLNAELIKRSRIYAKASELHASELLRIIFTRQDDWQAMTEWLIHILSSVAAGHTASGRNERHEYAAMICDAIRKLANSLTDCGIRIETNTFASLARRMIQTMRIPYDGQPLKGIQVMGILETRNLDFDNVLLMSMNDDNFPGTPSASASFIPYNLRFGYGLPTSLQHDGVYAYYFYRLLQRARTVDMVYSSQQNESSNGECSRYIYQLEYESSHKPVRKEAALEVTMAIHGDMSVEKTDNVMDRLMRYLRDYVSPTALNTYIACPLQFYFRYIAGLRPADELSEEIDNSIFGNIFHKAMEILYRPLLNVTDTCERIKSLIDYDKISAAVDKAICEVYFHDTAEPDDYDGQLLMVRDTVIRYIKRNVLPFDSNQPPFTIVALEQELATDFRFGKNGQYTARFAGKADRVDRLADGRIRIVDYKTGSPHNTFANTDILFDTHHPKHHEVAAVTQTLLYSMIVSCMQEAGKIEKGDICPALYYIRMMNKDDFSPQLQDKQRGEVTSYTQYKDEFEVRLDELLTGLCDPSQPFVQCNSTNACQFCDFTEICKR